MIVYLKSLIFIAILRGNLGKSNSQNLKRIQSFRNEWAVGLILISTFTSGNRPTKNQNYPY
jgi:hypothetical protein